MRKRSRYKKKAIRNNTPHVLVGHTRRQYQDRAPGQGAPAISTRTWGEVGARQYPNKPAATPSHSGERSPW
eukprot:2133772-Rhodomonas_salina.2